MGKLSGKVAVVTGGNSGMGLATARLFAAEGAQVVITGRRKKDTEDAAKSIGDKVDAVVGDIANLADLDKLSDYLDKKYGRVDILFANAGVGSFGPLGQVTEEQFDQVFDVNVKGTFFTVQKLLHLIPDGGSIILNGSIAGSKGLEAFSPYSATKAALRSFARTWTTDLKARKIRVNVISPGPIDTPIFGKAGLPPEAVDGYKAHMASQVPLGRIGSVDEIAKPALFLASSDSAFVTGVELAVDGGLAQI